MPTRCPSQPKKEQQQKKKKRRWRWRWGGWREARWGKDAIAAPSTTIPFPMPPPLPKPMMMVMMIVCRLEDMLSDHQSATYTIPARKERKQAEKKVCQHHTAHRQRKPNSNPMHAQYLTTTITMTAKEKERQQRKPKRTDGSYMTTDLGTNKKERLRFFVWAVVLFLSLFLSIKF